MDRRVAAALAGSAAASAAVAESAADLLTPPGLAWRWVVRTDALDLYSLASPADPDHRLTLIAGGGALHRARVALAADGLAVRVTLLPNVEADPDHLATLVATGQIPITAEAQALFDATEATSRRARPILVRGHHEVPPAEVDLAQALVDAAMAEGVGVSVRQESGELIAVLYGENTREAWLRAGEAVSAVRLEAARHGQTAVPTVAGRERPGPRTSENRTAGNQTPGNQTPRNHASPASNQTSQPGERRRDRVSVPYVHLRITPTPQP